tara:strand:+ start:939 stop:1169 length:231 start_codon:yes stop_codon:yes gene_type:complete
VVIDPTIARHATKLDTDFSGIAVVVASTTGSTLPLETNLPFDASVIITAAFLANVFRADQPSLTVPIGDAWNANVI